MVRHPFFAEAWIDRLPDWASLWRLAEGRSGFFTTAEARSLGIRRALLSYHRRRGTFDRVAHGLYRLARWPAEPEDPIRIAWMVAGPDHAVVSHWSALYLHALVDERPSGVDLIVPRARRSRIPDRETQWARKVFYHVRREVDPRECESVRGIRARRVEPALVDVLRTGLIGSVDFDRAVGTGATSWERLEAAVAGLRGPGSARARRSLDRAARPSEPPAWLLE